jgi:hypothetical protein
LVTFAQLRDMDVAGWAASASEWNINSGKLLSAARDLKNLVKAPLTGGAWTGPAGEQAAAHVKDLIERIAVASVECEAVSLVVHGLAHAFQIAQSSLRFGITTAQQEDFRVDGDGNVQLPPSPMVRHDPDYGAWCATERRRLQTLVDGALAAATEADHKGHDALDHLRQRTGVTKLSDAEDGDLGDASRLEVDLIAGVVPHGNRDEVAAWWASLSDDDRRTLKLAVPWAIEHLDGIPDDVKRDLKGTDKYDRTGVAKWAIDHWNDNSDDPFDNNCTNFASNALQGGGVKEHNDFWMGTLSDNSWYKGGQTGWGFLDEHDYSHSASWGQAQASYEFWTKHGHEVSLADARPGDIIYWEQDEGGYDIKPGTVHHAAVVTSVVDGDLRYTQHSGNQLNASLDGRGPVNELGGGRQKLHIVRPDPDW